MLTDSNTVTEIDGEIDKLTITIGGINTAAGSITSGVTTLQETINNLDTTVNYLDDVIKDHLDGVQTAIETKIDGAVTTIGGQIGGAVGTIEYKVDGAVTAINAATGTAVDGAVTAINAATGTAVGGAVDTINAATGTAVDGAVDTINAATGTAVGGAVTAINAATGTAVGGAVTTIEGQIEYAINTIGGQIGDAVDTIQGAIPTTGEIADAVAAPSTDDIVEGIAASTASTDAGSIGAALAGVVPSAEEVADAVAAPSTDDIVGGIAASTASTDAGSIGAALVSTLGASGGGGNTPYTIQEIVDAVVNAFMSSAFLRAASYEVIVTNGLFRSGFSLADFLNMANNIETFRNGITEIEISGVYDDGYGLSLTDEITGIFPNVRTIMANNTLLLGENAFGNDIFPALANVFLPSVTTIGNNAFAGTAITRLYLPSYEATEDESTPFGGAENLTELLAPKLVVTDTGVFSHPYGSDNPLFTTITINTFTGYTGSWEVAKKNDDYTDTTIIGMFDGQENLENLNLIGGCPIVLTPNTFRNCMDLKKVNLSNVHRFEANCLENANNLETKEITAYGIINGAFKGSAITTLHLDLYTGEKETGATNNYWTRLTESSFAGSLIETLHVWESQVVPLYGEGIDLVPGSNEGTHSGITQTLKGMTSLQTLHLNCVIYARSDLMTKTSLSMFGDENVSRDIDLILSGNAVYYLVTVDGKNNSLIASGRENGAVVKGGEWSSVMDGKTKTSSSGSAYPTWRGISFKSITLDIGSLGKSAISDIFP